MSEPQPSESASEGGSAAQPKRGSTRIALGLFVLLAGSFVVTQIVSRTGPPIQWRYDLAEAERAAGEQGRCIFLLLHEPGCKVTEANERDVLSTRMAKERLAQMICCRVALRAADPLRGRFGFRDQPLMLILRPGRDKELARLEGKVDDLQFATYVDCPTSKKGP